VRIGTIHRWIEPERAASPTTHQRPKARESSDTNLCFHSQVTVAAFCKSRFFPTRPFRYGLLLRQLWTRILPLITRGGDCCSSQPSTLPCTRSSIKNHGLMLTHSTGPYHFASLRELVAGPTMIQPRFNLAVSKRGTFLRN